MSRPPQNPSASEPPQIASASRRAPRGPSRFTQADLVKVLKATQNAGMPNAAVRIELDGTILVVPGTPESVANSCSIQDAADIIPVD